MSTPKGFALTALFGAIIFGIATIWHPLTYNPWAPTVNVLRLDRAIPVWEPVHSLLAAAVILWLGGLSAQMAPYRGPWGSLASRLWVAALTIWLVIFSVELTALPQLAVALPDMRRLAGPVFAATLVGGYFAALLMWLGVMAAGQALAPWFPRMSRWGRGSGLIGIVGVVYSLLLPGYALLPLAVSSAFPYLWTVVWAGWILWSRHYPPDPTMPAPR